jgi:solute carrier family 35 protein F1/2
MRKVLMISAVLAICITSTNTLSSLLSAEGTSIPAFQSFFNYVLLNLIYTSYTIYKYGFKRWTRLIIFEGWRFFILAFLDVEGNYFVVLAYRYVRPTPNPPLPFPSLSSPVYIKH